MFFLWTTEHSVALIDFLKLAYDKLVCVTSTHSDTVNDTVETECTSYIWLLAYFVIYK